MFHNTTKDKAKDVIDNAGSVSEKAQKSGKDWLDYVMEHPLQSLFFGATIGLAIRGLFKK